MNWTDLRIFSVDEQEWMESWMKDYNMKRELSKGKRMLVKRWWLEILQEIIKENFDVWNFRVILMCYSSE